MPRTFVCKFEGCELAHCRKCGGHFCPEIGGGTCDRCELDRVYAETEAVVRAFGGNSEAAAKAMGW